MRAILVLLALGVLAMGASVGACVSRGSAATQPGVDGGGDDAGDEGGIPCEGAGLSKGPLSLHIDGTSAVIRWEACRAGTAPGISYAPEGSGATLRATSVETPFDTDHTYRAINTAATPDYAGTWYMHEARLTGLTPGVCYRYGLDVDSTVQARFCTARNPGDEVRFLAIGDTNPALGDSTVNVLSHVLPKNPDFVVHGGDIEYYDSLVETYALWFRLMSPMLRQGAVFAAIGNHDTDFQSGEPSDKYEQYTQRFFGDAGFDGASGYYDFTSGGIWFFALDKAQPIDPSSVQFQWLVNRLQQVSATPGYRFSVVFMHQPFWTCGDTGDDPADLAQLSLVFAEYDVR
ncbi:MAG: metallophosphoesterase, partial [Polyangiaceae bacterium]